MKHAGWIGAVAMAMACATAPVQGPTKAAPVAAAPDRVADAAGLPVAAMVFSHPHGQSGNRYALRADGTVTADGKPTGTVRGARMLDATGQVLLEVAADGAVHGRGFEAGLHFDGDVLIRGDGRRIAVDSDGTIRVLRPGAAYDGETIGSFDRAQQAPRTAILMALLIGTSAPGAAPARVPAAAPAVDDDEDDDGCDDDDFSSSGCEGGVVGGVVGGSAEVGGPGAPPPPPPPPPARKRRK